MWMIEIQFFETTNTFYRHDFMAMNIQNNFFKEGTHFCTYQIFATKDNPAADPRQMRRIIAEDPDWLVIDLICFVSP